MSIHNVEPRSFTNDNSLPPLPETVDHWNELPPPNAVVAEALRLPIPQVPAPWEIPPALPIPQLTHDQAMAFQKKHNQSLLPKTELPDLDDMNMKTEQPWPASHSLMSDLDEFEFLDPIRPDLVIEGLPEHVEEELEAQKRKRRIPDIPIDPSLPKRKRMKLDRMKKNRESAQKSREKKARHRAVLGEQVKMLSLKNNQLTKAIGLLTTQATEAEQLRKSNSSLQRELYEARLQNERLKRLMVESDHSESSNTINITNHVNSAASRRSNNTDVTGTSNRTDSAVVRGVHPDPQTRPAVGVEASPGAGAYATPSCSGANDDKKRHETVAKPTKPRTDTFASAYKSASFAGFASAFSKLSAANLFNGSHMAGSPSNKLAVFNDLLENNQRLIPDFTGAMGLPPLFQQQWASGQQAWASSPRISLPPIQSVN